MASATGTSSSADASTGLDLSILTQLTRTFLENALSRIVGSKTLVIDLAIAGPLGLVTEVATLKAHGVDRMFYLEPGAISQAQRNIVYLCSASVPMMKIIADQIKHTDQTRHAHTLLISPRITSMCVAALQDEGVYGAVDIEAFPLEFLALEKDVVSLEIENSYKSIYSDGNYGAIFDMGKALMTFQQVYGLIPNIVGKGDSAQRLANTLLRMREELPSTSPLQPGAVDSLIIIDRQVDVVTPLCTQLTYEGLIDELLGIRNAHVEVDPNLVNPPPNALPSPSTTLTQVAAQAKRKKILLTAAADPLFGELRDKNFAVVGSVLNRVAKRINTDYEGIHNAQTITQIKGFVGRLGGLQAEHQSLRLHTGLTEEIMKTTLTDEFNKALEIQQNLVAGLDLGAQENSIRDLINQEADFFLVMRLLCLLSVISGGLKQRILEDFQREILQTYGYDHLPLFVALGNLGLLTKPLPTKSAFAVSRKPLRLVVDEVDEQAPDDIAYVYSGYAPLSVRLVQGALGRNGAFLGWKSIEDAIRPLPGKTVELKQRQDENAQARVIRSPDQPPVTVVCFLGGCTYTELSALRFVSNQGRGGRKIVIATTGMLNGKNLLASL